MGGVGGRCGGGRLQLHVHEKEKDNMVEVVIKRPSHSDREAPPSGPASSAIARRVPAIDLARKLKRLMARDPSPLAASTALTSLIDVRVKPQLLPLVIVPATLEEMNSGSKAVI